MEVTVPYILSQIFIIINYVLLMATYQVKSRKTILMFNFGAIIATGVSYVFFILYQSLVLY